MYELTDDEINAVVSQNVIPSKRYFGGSSPFAFTENGVAMLSNAPGRRYPCYTWQFRLLMSTAGGDK
jgi:hypothetical protein